MSAWKDSDEVTTTYGSIQLSLQQAHSAGIKTERERIIKLLEEYVVENNELYELTNDTGWDNRAHVTEICISLIKGETNE